MKIFKNHFNNKNTYIIGKQIINGCVTCTIEEFDGVCKKHNVPNEIKEEVIKSYWENGEDENWDKLAESDWRVRQAVAEQGYGLDKLVNDRNVYVRIEVAKQGYGLDKLVNDSYWRVRQAVAKQGYGLDKLINDVAWQVRRAVARQGYGLDKLINDEHWLVRQAVAQQGYGLDKLVDDEHWIVRRVVAEQGYGLDKLVNDSDWYVRIEARMQLKKLNNYEKNRQSLFGRNTPL